MIPTTDRAQEGAAIAIAWECLGNTARDDAFSARLVLRNDTGETIAPGWAICFNTCRKVLAESVSPGYAIAHRNGDLFCLSMPGGGAWLPGASHTVQYEARHWAISITDAPLGFYLLPGDGGAAVDLGDPAIAPFARPEQRRRMRDDRLPGADAAWRHAQDAALYRLPAQLVGRITPRPVSAQFDGRRCMLSRHAPLSYAGALWNEASLLAALLGGLPGLVPGGSADIVLEVGAVEGVEGGAAGEAYLLDIEPGRVRIRGASPHGVFNAIQSLAQLLEADGELPTGRVLDAPRFGYRGMMLDVARHFAGVATVLRLLDCMASYKLNRFHFHLTDDEGWRLAIGALPELTSVGARRGVAREGEACLPPSYGSGADADASRGSGFYTAADFVAILRHAHARHIEVIPEFNMPGHARAAVRAMRERYLRLSAAGELEAAQEYLLHDPDDTSAYESVQLWQDNVICIALDSCDRFIDTVVGEVCMLYREAGVPLRTIHTGGDEVPVGAWLGSPRCRARMAQHGWIDVQELHDDFVERCRTILARHGVQFAGWDETALVRQDGRMLPNPRFAGPDFHVYVWNNAWGSGQEDCAYRLANAGYQVVLCNAASLYFDLAYAKHPQEPGYYWAGFVDTRNAFGFCPLDPGALPGQDPMGRPPADGAIAALQPLDGQGRGRIAGLQGQLWGENVRSRQRLEYLALPRLIGLAERAWAPDPGWQDLAEPARSTAAQRDWNEFANRLGQRELPRLDRARQPWDYRLPPPGAVLRGGLLHANVGLPGLALHYTVDGQAPSLRSPRYDAPVPVYGAQAVQLASFDTRGRASRIVTLNVIPNPEQP